MSIQRHFSQSFVRTPNVHTARNSAKELEEATNKYSIDNLLREDLSYRSYQGTLEGRTITVSKVRGCPEPLEPSNRALEVAVSCQISHANVVKFIGCCLETRFPILVYEYFSDVDLFSSICKGSITWENRLTIAMDIAHAITYLHIGANLPIIHRSINSRNILLREGCNAKIIGFERSLKLPLGETQIETLVMGTVGYVDPVYVDSSQISEKSDVYSYGAVLFEIVAGKRPYMIGDPFPNKVEQFLQSTEEERMKFIESNVLKEAKKEQLVSFVQVIVKCLSASWEDRPDMKQVVQQLWRIKKR
ncbi:hypothetical protein ACLOJK_035739 [Asimina triloba]